MIMTNKLFIIIPILFLLSCVKEELNYKKLYPFFDSIKINKSDKTISLNNFKSKKNGLEYLLNQQGNLIEVRNYQDGYLNGNVFSYSTNGKLKGIAEFKNDTMVGNYFLLDTLSGKLKQYRERLNVNGSIIDNQIINYIDGNIDFKRSHFIRIKKRNEDEFEIQRSGYKGFPYLKIYLTEHDDDQLIFDKNKMTTEIISDDNQTINYKVQNKNYKYASGYLLSYRYPYEDEIKEKGYKQKEEIGVLTYFKIKLQ